MVAYKVGSADEDLDHTGLSHYLEHLMFKGTDKIKPGDIDRITYRNGGANNAYTDTDYTIFHFDFAADRWEAALEIEADRMQNLRIDEKHEFEQEKGRRHQRAEAQRGRAVGPGAQGDPAAAVRQERPLRPSRSSAEKQHVRGATAEIIKAHYDKWYHPNNASLVVVRRLRPRQGAGEDQGAVRPHPEGGIAGAQNAFDGAARSGPAARDGLQVRRAAAADRLQHGVQQERRLPGPERAGGFAERPHQPAVQEAGRGRTDRRVRRRQPQQRRPLSRLVRDPGRVAQQEGRRPQAEKLVLAELKKLADEPITRRRAEARASSSCWPAPSSAAKAFTPWPTASPRASPPTISISSKRCCRASWPSRPPTCSAVAKTYLDPDKRVVVWSVPKGEAKAAGRDAEAGRTAAAPVRHCAAANGRRRFPAQGREARRAAQRPDAAAVREPSPADRRGRGAGAPRQRL